MFGIGMPDLLIILGLALVILGPKKLPVIILIIFGAGKLPEIGSGVGKAIRNFKGATKEDEPPKEPEKIEDKKDS